MTDTRWSEKAIRELLQHEDFYYQDITLPHGLSTGGKDRSATARAIFPPDLRDKTVLDLGCKYGYFCFEAAKRNAAEVHGVDVSSDNVRKAALLSEILNVKATFSCADIEKQQLSGTYDYVLCLNLLHHLKDPIAALEKLIVITQERLILEVAALGHHDLRKVRLTRLGRMFINRHPIIFVSENGTSRKRGLQKFFITRTATYNLLFHHRKIFSRVDFLSSEHKNRYIAIAHRRRINRMLIIAGPTAAGKKHLMNKLKAGQAPELAKNLGLKDFDDWRTINAEDLDRPTESEIPNLLFGYDIMRPHLRSAEVHERDEALDILQCAKSIRVVTIWCSPQSLLERHKAARLKPYTTLGIYWGPKRHPRINREFQDRSAVYRHYRKWIDFIRQRNLEHIMVDYDNDASVMSEADWDRKANPDNAGESDFPEPAR